MRHSQPFARALGTFLDDVAYPDQLGHVTALHDVRMEIPDRPHADDAYS
jgi:hypothetical protein